MEHQDVPLNVNEDVIPSSIEGIIGVLARRGCLNLTSSINLAASSDRPCAGGGFCDVYRGVLDDGAKVAIRSLRVYESSSLEGDSEAYKALKRAANEIYHWSKLNHPNVLPLMGLAIFKGYLSMISGWMENGNLTTYIERKPDADRLKLCMDVCAGLSYIHTKGMVHGDLKGANIMISSDGTAMIADFGNAQLRDLTLKFINTPNSALSIRWTAPELLLEEGIPQVSMEADVYAYGMIVLEALTGKVPYHGISDTRVMWVVASEKRVPSRPNIGLSDGLWELLNSCWAQVPSKRPKITSVGDRLEALVPPPMRSIEETIGVLARRGCVDLTSDIDWTAFSERPAAGGGFGDIYRRALHNGTRIAIKSLRVYDHFEGGYETQKALKRAAKELYYWSKLKHPNILPLMGLAVFKDSLSMVSEWMEDGDLITYLKLNPDADRIRLCMGICSGLCYIHANGMVHGDVKGKNILIARDGSAMIAGFGSIRPSDPTLEFLDTEGDGISVRWAAPEILLEEYYQKGTETDVYAYGMTALETLTGKVPYNGFHELRVMQIIISGEKFPPRPDGISDGLWELFNSCWAWVPSERPKITTVRDRLDALFPSYSERTIASPRR